MGEPLKRPLIFGFKNCVIMHLNLNEIMQNSPYIEKGILSASIKALQIKFLYSFCTSSIEPLGSKVSTTIKCSVSLPDNEASSRNNGRATPYLIKRHFRKSQYSKCYFGVLKKTVKLMGRSEDSHHFL